MGYRIAINKMALDSKLPEGDYRWAAFNDGFENLERETIDFANDIFTGHAYAAWHNGRRKIDNFVCAQHIAVDMDTEDERSAIDTIRKNEFVAVYGGLIYTTPNHLPEAPRSRIVFFLDQPIMEAEAYKAAIGFVYSLFPDPDPSCVDSSRFFYGSKDCQIEWIDKVLPLAHLRNYYRRWQKQNPKPEQKPQTQTRIQAPSNFNKDVYADLQEALRKINPWSISYQDWVRVLMAIHHDLGDAGLSIAEQWAQGKEGEVKGKFRSFKANGNGKIVTLKTVFGMAKTH